MVRISEQRSVFAKGYEGGCSLEFFKIVRISETRQPAVYYLEDLNGESLDCFFYEQELSRVQKTSEDLYKVAEILKTRDKGKNQECLVHWQGYGPEFDSWIKKSVIVDL